MVLNNIFSRINYMIKKFIINNRFIFRSANDIRKAFELSLKVLDNTNDKLRLIHEVSNRINNGDKICRPYFEKLNNFAKRQLKIWINR